ncbi:MAG TPA: aminotransferase class I/II-fold pyridoxal phosphate-dependent enzyme [Candidatus Krumholzibacteria bacterium]|nr:aminotransferase class I/II-fold pyridoxal phosphate-dependent enzyme [Candidatus Krumholzibacteria bacterium]
MPSKPLREGAPDTPGTPDPAFAKSDAKPAASPSPAAPAPSAANDLDYSNFFWGSGKDPFDILDPFDDWFDEARPQGYYLFGQPMSSMPASRIDVVEQLRHERLKNLINLASYNYLGLSVRPEVIEAARAAILKYGTGSSGSPILSGTMEIHEELQRKIADFKDKESCLLFPSGYSANVGVIAGLMRSGDLVVTDQFAHASIVDGIILSKAQVRYFRHNNAADLDRKLKDFTGRKLVIVEGVYSMDGDLANLPEIVEVCQRNGARIMIDEAHSAFLFGPNGRGVAEHFGLDDEIDIHLGTFSKSLGGQGGYVAGSRKLIRYLKGFGRSHVFSCALAPGVVGGLIKACDLARTEPQLRDRLWENTHLLQALLRERNVDIGDSKSQVIPIMIRDDDRIFKVAEDMIHHGVYLNPVRYPAVGKHRSRLRISVTAAHTREELHGAADIIARVLDKHGFLCR